MKKFFVAIVQCILVPGIFFTVGSTVNAVPWLHVEGNQLKDSSGNSIVLRGVDREHPTIAGNMGSFWDKGDKGDKED